MLEVGFGGAWAWPPSAGIAAAPTDNDAAESSIRCADATDSAETTAAAILFAGPGPPAPSPEAASPPRTLRPLLPPPPKLHSHESDSRNARGRYDSGRTSSTTCAKANTHNGSEYATIRRWVQARGNRARRQQRPDGDDDDGGDEAVVEEDLFDRRDADDRAADDLDDGEEGRRCPFDVED